MQAYNPPKTIKIPQNIQPTSRIPPRKTTRKEIFLGLTREQAWVLSLALSGMDLLIEGAGGTGKSHVLDLFIQEINKKDINIIYVSPITKDWIQTQHPSEKINLSNSKKNVVIADELTSITPKIIENLPKISQIVIAGDLQQEERRDQYEAAREIIEKRKGVRTLLTQIWRSSNKNRTNTCNALLYNNIYDAPPNKKIEKEPATRFYIAKDKEEAEKITLTRLIHHAKNNSELNTLIAAETEDTLAKIIRIKKNLKAEKTTITHTSLIQGKEADIFIGMPETDSLLFGFHALGRAKYQSEIILTSEHKNLIELLRKQAEPKNPNIGQHWKKTNNSLIVPAGPDPQSTMRRVSVAASLGWNARPGNLTDIQP